MIPATNLAKYELNQARLRTQQNTICFSPSQVNVLRKLGKLHDNEITLHRDGVRPYYTLSFSV